MEDGTFTKPIRLPLTHFAWPVRRYALPIIEVVENILYLPIDAWNNGVCNEIGGEEQVVKSVHKHTSKDCTSLYGCIYYEIRVY